VGATLVRPRRVHESSPVGVCGRAKSLSREVAWFIRRAGGNSGAASTRVRSHACRGAWMQTVVLSGTAAWIRSSGVLQSRHVLRESNDLRLCGLDVGCAPSGRAAGPQGLDSFSSPATLRATISRSQHQRADRNLSREVRFVSAAPPSGACGIRGAPLFERCATLQALCMTPTCKPVPFGGPGRPLRPTPATDLPLIERQGLECCVINASAFVKPPSGGTTDAVR